MVASPRAPIAAQGQATEADLEQASGGRTVRVGNLDSGRVTAMPIEVYVARVLAGEGEPRAADAAQQALAVAIRTFAAVNTNRHRREGFDLCDSTHCQVLRTSTAATRRAALATAGQVLTYQGRPAEVYYSASCGGQSEAAADVWPGANYPYLRSVVDDVHDGDVPWTATLTLSEIEEALKRAGFASSRLTAVEVDARSESGRATRLRVAGMEPAVIAGEQFRAAVGATVIRSTAFTVTRTPGGVRFVGRGYGHGVGLCVIGAGRRAMRGESFRDILARYYPGLELKGADVVVTRAAPAAAPTPRNTAVVIRSSGQNNAELERLAVLAHTELSRTLGVSVAPVAIELHDTIEDFRLSTGQPWWVGSVTTGTTIDLAPLPVLAQGDGLERAIRTAMAELLVAGPLAGRPAWVRTGAARYFAARRSETPSSAQRVRCPADAELTLAISAVAQRDAETRAEACFARAYAQTKDWRAVR